MKVLKKCHNIIARVIGNTVLIGCAVGAGFIAYISIYDFIDQLKEKRLTQRKNELSENDFVDELDID